MVFWSYESGVANAVNVLSNAKTLVRKKKVESQQAVKGIFRHTANVIKRKENAIKKHLNPPPPPQKKKKKKKSLSHISL